MRLFDDDAEENEHQQIIREINAASATRELTQAERDYVNATAGLTEARRERREAERELTRVEREIADAEEQVGTERQQPSTPRPTPQNPQATIEPFPPTDLGAHQKRIIDEARRTGADTQGPNEVEQQTRAANAARAASQPAPDESHRGRPLPKTPREELELRLAKLEAETQRQTERRTSLRTNAQVALVLVAILFGLYECQKEDTPSTSGDESGCVYYPAC